MTSDSDIVRELFELPADRRPLQFGNLVTGSQYLPIYRLAGRFIQPGQEALDWGCGNGHFSYFLLRRGLQVQGFSLEPEGNALATHLGEKFPDRYRMVAGDPANPVRLPFPDQRFDLVFSIGVLEHVRETGGSERASLSEIARVLKPGGHFICGMLPKKYSWIEFLVRNMRPDKHHHLFRYTKSDIAKMMREAGLALLKTDTHGFLPRNSWNHHRLRPISGLPSISGGFNAIDRMLAQSIRPIAQNFMFAARRSAAPTGGT